jgi:hypothetical protein
MPLLPNYSPDLPSFVVQGISFICTNGYGLNLLP